MGAAEVLHLDPLECLTGRGRRMVAISPLQPFAKRLAVADLGDFENKQRKTDPKLGFDTLNSVYSLIQTDYF